MTRAKTFIMVILLVALGTVMANAGSNTTGQIEFKTALAYLDQDDVRLCRNGAYSLGEIGDKRAVEALAKKLKSEDHHLRRIAANALGKIGDQEAVMPLIEALCDQEENVQVQMAAVKALGRLGDKRAARILIHLASLEKSRLQSEACCALKKLSPMLYAAYVVNDKH